MENKSCVYCTIDLTATGKRIRSLMSESGLSVKDLCKIVSVSNQTVYRWLNGQALPSIDNLVQLSEIFKVGIDDIVVRGESVSYDVPELYIREASDLLDEDLNN